MRGRHACQREAEPPVSSWRMTAGGPPQRQRLVAFWHSVAPLVRRTCYILWSAGVVFFVLGYLGDEYGCWDSRPFATNVVSSAATGLFAVPIALKAFRS